MKEGGAQKIFLRWALLFGFFIFLLCGARAADAATLYFSPSSGNFTVGNVFTVNVLVNTENADINNAETTVNFPSGLLEIISISKSGSIFSLWVEEPTFSNGVGTLSFNGGLPTPGFKGASGKVIGATFRVKKAGSASLVFSSTAVRANDGYGTDVFRTGIQAQFNLISEERPAQPPAEEAPPAAVSVPRLAIRSTTHPAEGKWYSNNDPICKLDLPAYVNEVILVLSRRANSPPLISYIPPISEKVLDDVGEGEWYLNARARTSAGLGPVTSFKFNVDIQPPKGFNITRLDTGDPTNPQPQLSFATTDDTSGIDRYEIKIGDGDWLKIEPELSGLYKMPLQLPGARGVIVRALDKAGNYAESDYQLEVQSIEPPILDQIEKPQVKKGEILTIEGKAKPNQKIRVVIKVNTEYITEYVLETHADADGYWQVEFKPEQKGRYEVLAQAVDERGAISIDSNRITFNVKSASIPELFFDLLMKGFDGLIKLIMSGWLFIFITLFIGGLIYAIAEKVIPAVRHEIKKINYLMGEYRLDKKLKNKDSKIRLEIRVISEDIKKELALLKKIENHRRLHPDEKYLKNKLERYSNLIKNMK